MSPLHEFDLLVIGGPTATGKTETALNLARAFGGELIGADSVQVYRDFDIGSAKPRAGELGGIPHHLLDVLDPDEDVDAQRYANMADAAITDIQRRGAVPIVVGGTGLWIRALLFGLVDLPPVDPALRARLEELARMRGAPALHERLLEVDPLAAAKIHPNDALRIVRALEVFEQTGTPLGELRERHSQGGQRYRALFCVLDRPQAELSVRIEARADQMLAAGLIDEVRDLLARYGPEVRALGAVGYREIVDHLTQGRSLDETRAKLVSATRRYARHQRTWFRGERGVDCYLMAERLTEERVLAAAAEASSSTPD